MPPIYDEDDRKNWTDNIYDKKMSYDEWVKNGHSAGPSDGKGSNTVITDVPALKAPNNDPKFSNDYWDNTTWGSYEPKAKKSSGSGSGYTTKDPYADYRGNLEDLYNKVMGYGSYTAGTYNPGSFGSSVDTTGIRRQLNGWLGEIDNYGDFKYDLNGDMLYKQMADNYVQQGQLAAQNVMAQASALSGGYGNSYAASVGNQAYQQHLTQLNNNIPALQQQALNVWQSGLDRLLSQYNAGSQQLNNLLAIEAAELAAWKAQESANYNAFKLNESNAYNEWLAGYNQLMDQYDLGVDHGKTMVSWQPQTSSYSGSSKKTSTSSGPTKVTGVLNALGNTNNGAAAGGQSAILNMLSPELYEEYAKLLKK